LTHKGKSENEGEGIEVKPGRKSLKKKQKKNKKGKMGPRKKEIRTMSGLGCPREFIKKENGQGKFLNLSVSSKRHRGEKKKQSQKLAKNQARLWERKPPRRKVLR